MTPLRFNYVHNTELIYDNHAFILKPVGARLVSTLWVLSLYGTYYYYTLANNLYFGIATGSSILMTIGLFNFAVVSSVYVGEIILLPGRDKVRILLMDGKYLE